MSQISTSGLLPANNLSELTSSSTARTNLGLGSAATQASSAFLQVSNNLSDLANTATAQTNLGLGAFPRWQKFTIGFAALQTAGLTNNALVLTLPIKGVITGSFINVTTAFAGTLITSLLATVGTTGSNAKYFASSSLLSTGLLSGLSVAAIAPESSASTTAINIYVTAIGANLSALSQGSVDVYLLIATTP